MYYSTLGYDSNPLICLYQERFVQKLKKLWVEYIDSDIPEELFLLFPDIHWLLLASMRHNIPMRWEYLNILRSEYMRYKRWENLMNDYEKIAWTNIVLTLDFNNPDIRKHNHPDHKEKNIGITFWDKSRPEWQELFATSFDILRRISPGFMNEIEHIIRKIIPFDVSHGVHNSGSYSNVIGHLVMSYPTGMEHPELALLEAILHEYNHNKLNLILQTELLILNDRREIYYSPYRPDARHIYGIYLGLHAIVGAYWVIWNAHNQRVLILSGVWQEKAVLYVLKNGLSLQVLDKYAILSPLWKEILEEMRQVHHECLECIKKSDISSEVMERARLAMVAHYREVSKNYPWLRS